MISIISFILSTSIMISMIFSNIPDLCFISPKIFSKNSHNMPPKKVYQYPRVLLQKINEQVGKENLKNQNSSSPKPLSITDPQLYSNHSFKEPPVYYSNLLQKYHLHPTYPPPLFFRPNWNFGSPKNHMKLFNPKLIWINFVTNSQFNPKLIWIKVVTIFKFHSDMTISCSRYRSSLDSKLGISRMIEMGTLLHQSLYTYTTSVEDVRSYFDPKSIDTWCSSCKPLPIDNWQCFLHRKKLSEPISYQASIVLLH